MFTVVSSFQSTVALHKTPLYILHYEASERSAVSYTHSGITGTGCSTGAMSATSAAKSTGGSISSLQTLCSLHPNAGKRHSSIPRREGQRYRQPFLPPCGMQRQISAFLSLFFLSTQQSVPCGCRTPMAETQHAARLSHTATG